MRTFTATRAIDSAPYRLESIRLISHGGAVQIEWFSGSWAPLRAGGRSVVSLYIDRKRVVSTFANGSGGKSSARPGVLRWVGTLSPGRHQISVKLERATAGTALPLVRRPARVPEGLDVTEYVN